MRTRSIASSAPLSAVTRVAGTPSSTKAAVASSASSGSTGSAPYSRCGASMSRSAAAMSGSSAGSGLPVTRSRAPAGTAANSNRERTGGRSATRSPLRGRETTTPRRRRSATAAATVAVLTPSAPAMRRTDGSASPGSSFPAAMSASILAAISLAPEPCG